MYLPNDPRLILRFNRAMHSLEARSLGRERRLSQYRQDQLRDQAIHDCRLVIDYARQKGYLPTYD